MPGHVTGDMTAAKALGQHLEQHGGCVVLCGHDSLDQGFANRHLQPLHSNYGLRKV